MTGRDPVPASRVFSDMRKLAGRLRQVAQVFETNAAVCPFPDTARAWHEARLHLLDAQIAIDAVADALEGVDP